VFHAYVCRIPITSQMIAFPEAKLTTIRFGEMFVNSRGVRLQALTVVTLVYSLLPKSPNDSFGVNLLQWCENRSRRIL